MRLQPLLLLSALLLVLLVALAAGCGGGSSGQEIERERDGVRLTLSVNGEQFEQGETIELSVEAENLRDETLTYGFVEADQPALQLLVESELGGEQVINAADDPLGAEDLTLEPGKKIGAEVDWDQTLAIYVVPVQAPEGEYTIEGRLMVNDPAGGDAPIAVTAAVTVALRGGEQILPIIDAIRTAITQPELRDWMDARNATSAICLYQPTQVFLTALLADDTVQEILPELYRVQLENGFPVCSPVSAGGDEWRVQFFASNGPDPKSVAVYMDIHTGENSRWEEGALEPLTSPAP